MRDFKYTPDEEVKMHDEGAIRLLLSNFQSHEDGLPEWLKNSADAYAREDVPEQKRVIVVVTNDGKRGRGPSISCLDFVGMTSRAIEENFRVWADPNAARRGSDSDAIQGGHGNGGKCYMVQMFEDYAQLYAVRGEKGNRYGVVGGSFRFGYIPDREAGRNFPVADVRDELGHALKGIGCSLGMLAKVASDVVGDIQGFTLVTGVRPKGMGKSLRSSYVADNLQEHTQMIRTLELCRVYLMSNGKLYSSGEPLQLPKIIPMPGGTEPRVVEVPQLLLDPKSEEMISTTDGGRLGMGRLTLKTSQVSMRWSKKGRHNISFRAKSGYIGYVSVLELDVESSYRDRIYGECELQALERFKQNDRSRLASSPLTRAVELFISEQIEKYAKEFESLDKKKYNQEEKNALSRMNEALDEWKNRAWFKNG